MTLEISSTGHVLADVNGKSVSFLVDTGATLSLLNFDVPQTSQEMIAIKGVTGSVLNHALSKPLPVTLGDKVTWARFIVAPGAPTSLLGQDLLQEFGTQLTYGKGKAKLIFIGSVFTLDHTPKKEVAIPWELRNVPSGLWSRTTKDIGLLKSALPVVIKTKGGHPPAIKQYPIPAVALPSLRKQIQTFLDEGILKPIMSPFNTPILPVSKNRLDEDGDPEYRFVQDLRAINDYVEAPHPVVPDPSLILTEIPSWAHWYTVLDLTGAFFSIPVAEESHPLFAFTWEGRQLTWTRLPQGFTASPTLFSQILKYDLQDIELPNKSALIQYVDDLLVASRTREACAIDTEHLCIRLYHKGHRASLAKLQFCEPEVKYLGFVLAGGVRKIDPDRINAILQITPPVTKKQMRAFLGQAGFCRPWILGFSELARPLIETTKDKAPEPIVWTPELSDAFASLKQALVTAPALGLPNYSKPFTLYATEKGGIAKGVLVQPHGPYERPVGYYSVALDPVIKGSPHCLRSVAAAVELVEKVRPLVLGHKLIVAVPHEVELLLTRYATKSLSPQRTHRYEAILLLTDNISLKRSKPLNPSTLLPEVHLSNDPHDCVQFVTTYSKTREDLQDVPLAHPDLNLFTDGSSYYLHGKRFTGFAVATENRVLFAEPLSPALGAQAAELIALTRAATFAKGLRVNIYTDSKYAFGICHSVGALWKERVFLTSAGHTIAHGQLIHDLLLAIQEPREIAVIYIPAHTKRLDSFAHGNALADSAARAAAVHDASPATTVVATLLPFPVGPALYDELDEEELNKWKRWEATQQDSIWKLGDKPLLPMRYVLPLTRWIHDHTHGGPEAVASKIQQLWAAPGVYSAAKRLTDSCTLCKKYGVTKVTTVPGKRPPAYFPFQKLQIDFAELPPSMGYKYILVIVDQLSHWVEAFPTRKNDSKIVVKTLLRDIIPRYGIPEIIDSDRGPHFTAAVLMQVYVALDIQAAFHTPYHPQSSGQVERMNRTIKDRLAKVTADTGLKWPEALPLVLWDLRTTPHATTKLSPAEVLFGRVLAVPFTFMSAKTALLEGDEAVTQYLLYLQNSFTQIRNHMHWYQGVTPEIQELRNLSQIVLQNQMALDILLASQGGVCTMLNSSCCMYIDQSKQLITEVDKIWKVSHVMQQIQRDDANWGVADLWQWMTSWFPDLGTLVKKILMIVIVIVIVFVIIFVLIHCMSMFCNCCCNLLNQQKLYYRYQ
ncbi:protein NYNRIN-like isoform X1 [Columba livia]|uniref:protein NYNRIN-like isoform X1 n=1 Tax=Columba livia TaxID=8932 RepID=UPI0031BA9B04